MDGLGTTSPSMDWDAADLEGSWKRFMEHSNFVFNRPLKKKTEEEKCNYLMIWVGEKGRRIYQTWGLSDDEKKVLKSYTDNFERSVKPRTNTMYNRYIFQKRTQHEDELFEHFVTELQILVKDCGYDKPDEMVRDNIVFGVKNSKIKEKCMNVGSDLTLERTLEIARAYEISKSQTRSMDQDREKVNFVKNGARPKSKGNSKPKVDSKVCSRYGYNHSADAKCPAMGKKCTKCKKLNHFISMCKPNMNDNEQKKHKKSKKRIHALQSDTDSSDEFFVGVIESGKNKNSWTIDTKINDEIVQMQLDTGAHCNVMSLGTLKKIGITQCNKKKGENPKILKSYSGHRIPVLGTKTISCKINNQTCDVKFHIVEQQAETILGFETCESLNLVQRVRAILKDKNEIEQKYPNLFTELGKLSGEHKITIDNNVTPVVHPPRKIPIALKESVRRELDSMEKQGVIYKQDKPTEWVNSMVTVIKPNGKLRICMDPRDLNRAIKREHYPMRTIDEILPSMSGAKIFSKLDASCGFWQCALDEPSQELCTMNTPFGRYSFKRLPYGIKSASEVYQKLISKLVEDIEGCESIIDDIIIWGRDEKEHDERLNKVLKRLNDSNLRLNKDKCEFRKTEISYVGHVLTSKGLKPDDEKVRAVREMKRPENSKQMMTFLGFINYLGKFIKNLSEKTEPLRQLLQKDIHWHWDKIHDDAFESLKLSVSQAPVLKYFDEKQPVTLSVDASSTGLGAVILQNDQPVAYGSRALTTSQRNYAQIEKEALAILYGCTKFHTYLFGREVHVESDHKPLQAIFQKPLHQAPARLQRILLSLQKYDLKVQYKPGKEMVISDCLSRAYLNETNEDLITEDLSVNLLTYLPVSEAKQKEFQEATKLDPEMDKLVQVVQQGWPEKQDEIPTSLKPYWNFCDEITYIDGMLFKSHKLIVPKSLRSEMLHKIHEAHSGIVKCKSRARETLFWPGVCQQVEDFVSKCEICALGQNRNAKEPLITVEVPDRPWSRISADLFHFRGNNYLLTVDRYSSWPEIAKLDNLSSANTISYLKCQFSKYGIPDELYTDNGPQFSSVTFSDFTKDYGFKHVTSSPTFAQSNGLVERTVQTVKSMLKKAKDPYKSLMIYRDTVIESTGLSPAQMFLGRRLKTNLPITKPLLKPQQHDNNIVKSKREIAQKKQKFYFDQHCGKELPQLKPGEQVVMRQENESNKWEPAKIVSSHSSPRSYVLEQPNGKRYRRNRKHLRSTQANFQNGRDSEYDDILDNDIPEIVTNKPHSIPKTMEQSVTTRSGRSVKFPSKYKDFVVKS